MKWNRMTAAALAASMVLSVSASAMALTPQESAAVQDTTAKQTTDQLPVYPNEEVPAVTESYKIGLNPYMPGQIETWNYSNPHYNHWKIAAQNTSDQEMRIEITKRYPDGDRVAYFEVPAHTTKVFYSDPNSVLDDTYYIRFWTKGYKGNLKGNVWYKYGTSAEAVRK